MSKKRRVRRRFKRLRGRKNLDLGGLKEALERFFPEFPALLFPAIHAEIDWPKGVQFLDKEFQPNPT
ncbi:hypothetical protein [Thiorhodovibrio winogradskyi]|uniref:hypothetical protein n=1 Tax=Thiorhodovibrio winogradskyi TaxID=77007 RepID=UPI002E2B7B14|nr:hypothetical protein [Thiorhodovibrio winogradskyi]